jgi:hypothetical protein
MSKNDRELGMHRSITRRDFVNGAAVSIAGAAMGAASAAVPGWASDPGADDSTELAIDMAHERSTS